MDRKIPIVWDHQDISEHAGKGHFSIEVWNEKISLLLNVISQDGNYARSIPVDLRAIGITLDEIERSLHTQGARKTVSGVYPLDRILKVRLKREMGEQVKPEVLGQTALIKEET